MTTAILFGYYRNPQMCFSRIEILRTLNPGIPIYGLYTGAPSDLISFAETVEMLDGNYIYPEAKDEWKWANFDKVVSGWYREVGLAYKWNHLFIHAWDLLILEPVCRYVDPLKQGESFVPGLRPVEEMDENIVDPLQPPKRKGKWFWKEQDDYLLFKKWLAEKVGPEVRIYCENSPFAIVSRELVEAYSEIEADIPGFNEYRFPTVASILGFTLKRTPLPDQFWQCINMIKKPYSVASIYWHGFHLNGPRVFHPVYLDFNIDHYNEIFGQGGPKLALRIRISLIFVFETLVSLIHRIQAKYYYLKLIYFRSLVKKNEG